MAGESRPTRTREPDRPLARLTRPTPVDKTMAVCVSARGSAPPTAAATHQRRRVAGPRVAAGNRDHRPATSKVGAAYLRYLRDRGVSPSIRARDSRSRLETDALLEPSLRRLRWRPVARRDRHAGLDHRSVCGRYARSALRACIGLWAAMGSPIGPRCGSSRACASVSRCPSPKYRTLGKSLPHSRAARQVDSRVKLPKMVKVGGLSSIEVVSRYYTPMTRSAGRGAAVHPVHRGDFCHGGEILDAASRYLSTGKRASRRAAPAPCRSGSVNSDENRGRMASASADRSSLSAA